jgi:signal transduction histidine kinase
VQLYVKDTGGLAAQHLHKIVAPLYTTKPGGTGLRLYLVQEMLSAHGGQATVESVPGLGSTLV